MDLKRYEMTARENRYALTDLCTPYIAFELDEKIDEVLMLGAIRKAIRYHPLFGMRIVFDNGLFYFEENSLPPLLFNQDTVPEVYGAEANNYYPWLFVVKGKFLISTLHHAMADGMGFYNFIMTVLHLYYESRDVVFEDTTSDFPKCSPEETLENATAKYAASEEVSVGIPRFASPVKIGSQFIQDDFNEVYNLNLPHQEIRRFAKESETSVFSVIGCILARAMARAYHIESGNISVRIPVNYRSFFPTGTDRNFSQGFSLMYIAERMNNMSDALVETALRSQLDIWLEKGNLVRTLRDDMAQLERFKAGSEEIQKIFSFRMPADPTANILYTHITRINCSEELLSRIQRIIQVDHGALKDFVSVFGVTIHSMINLSIQQNSKDNCYIDALREVLDERGIKYTLEPAGEIEPDYKCVRTSEMAK